MTKRNGRASIAIAALAALGLASGALGASTVEPIDIVLVHGALMDGSTWRGVYEVLTNDGFRVRVVQQPLTGLADDVAATARVIDQLEGPVVLVGHSQPRAVANVIEAAARSLR
jgi:pimeloyl-ACP methyl ester carboxylesterase